MQFNKIHHKYTTEVDLAYNYFHITNNVLAHITYFSIRGSIYLKIYICFEKIYDPGYDFFI